MTYTYVISHYKENLNWLSNIPKESVHIYSKGGIPLDVPYKVEYLPNIGREAHTYLHYICTHYDNLPEMVAFCQGSDDHVSVPDMLNRINTLGQQRISGPISVASLYHNGLDSEHRLKHWKGDLTPSQYNFIDWFRKFVNPTVGPNLNIIYGACFVVSREAILSRSKEYYQELLEQSSVGMNTEVSHYFERSWFYVFNA
jgi:hypothetical protein